MVAGDSGAIRLMTGGIDDRVNVLAPWPVYQES
jgi:hypothetical protein